MPKYLCTGSYTQAGLKGLLEEGGTSRAEAVAKACEAFGGKLESFYYALGKTDFYIVIDMPGNVDVAAASMMVNVAGTSRVSYTALMSPREIDKAAKVAASKMGDYRPPGQ